MGASALLFGDLPADEDRTAPMSGTRDHGHIFLPIGLFSGIFLLIAADLASDYHSLQSPAHLWLEVVSGGLAILGVGLFARLPFLCCRG